MKPHARGVCWGTRGVPWREALLSEVCGQTLAPAGDMSSEMVTEHSGCVVEEPCESALPPLTKSKHHFLALNRHSCRQARVYLSWILGLYSCSCCSERLYLVSPSTAITIYRVPLAWFPSFTVKCGYICRPCLCHVLPSSSPCQTFAKPSYGEEFV